MLLIGESSERWPGHRGGALMNGISDIMKEIPQNLLAPSTMGEYS